MLVHDLNDNDRKFKFKLHSSALHKNNSNQTNCWRTKNATHTHICSHSWWVAFFFGTPHFAHKFWSWSLSISIHIALFRCACVCMYVDRFNLNLPLLNVSSVVGILHILLMLFSLLLIGIRIELVFKLNKPFIYKFHQFVFLSANIRTICELKTFFAKLTHTAFYKNTNKSTFTASNTIEFSF